MNVVGFGIIKSATYNTTFRVSGTVNSTNCQAIPAAIDSMRNLTFTASDLLISNYTSAAIYMNGTLKMDIANDLKVSRSEIVSRSDFPAILVLQDSNSTVFAGNRFDITGHRHSGEGGALALYARTKCSVQASSILFEANHASISGGAIHISQPAALSLRSTTNLVFRNNSAIQDGGAIFGLDPMSILTISGNPNILFDSNTANRNGGAVCAYSNTIGPLTIAAFWNNAALEGCAVYTSDCQPFNTNGSYAHNIHYANDISCEYSASMCNYVPGASPPSTQARACPGQAPTASSYCRDGVWVVPASELEVIAPVVVISSPVFVTGNLTAPFVTVTNVLGNAEPILQSDGCFTIETINVELTEEDVKSLDSGARTALLTRSSCDSSNTLVSASGSKPKRSCKKIESEAVRDGRTLSASFRVNSSRCNVWWIVLLSMLGVVVVGVIIAILVIQTRKKKLWNQDQNRLK
jgi:predicted outer membrane repeat protein